MTEKYIPIKDTEKYVSEDSFPIIGKQFFKAFLEIGNLQPHENFLDVGSGVGRIAIPLTSYLKDGKYEGFDIHSEGIEWCRKNIESKYPNFSFRKVNVYNSHYNETGKILASDFQFPYPNDSFDFVNLSSVFTHMLPKDMENYFSEISRILKKNGRCCITYFLLNSESLSNMENKKTALNFKFSFDGFRSNVKIEPEKAIAYEEKYIRKLYQKHYLEIMEPIYYGKWSGRKACRMGQDVIFAIKN